MSLYVNIVFAIAVFILSFQLLYNIHLYKADYRIIKNKKEDDITKHILEYYLAIRVADIYKTIFIFFIGIALFVAFSL